MQPLPVPPIPGLAWIVAARFAVVEPKKRHDGYRSFSYLVEGEDYVAYDLVPKLGRVEPTVVPLSDEDDARAERLLRERDCVSLHDHAGIAPADWDDNDDYIRQGREWYGFRRARGERPRCGLRELLRRDRDDHVRRPAGNGPT